MDLTEAIIALTKAVEANTTAILRGGSEPSGFHKPAEVGSTPTPASDPAPEDRDLTYDLDVRPLALQVSGEKGRDELIALLASFGAKKGTELKPEQYGEFVARAREVLAN